jgi:hypothetical protein
VRELTVDDHGVFIKTTPTYRIYVTRKMFNWRLHTVRRDGGPLDGSDRFWCYEGTGAQSFIAAVAAARAWDGADHTEPPGWTKNGQTGEWRPNVLLR